MEAQSVEFEGERGAEQGNSPTGGILNVHLLPIKQHSTRQPLQLRGVPTHNISMIGTIVCSTSKSDEVIIFS